MFKKRMTLTLLSLILILFFFRYQNNHLVVTRYEIKNDGIPIDFNQYRIVQLSDLHNKWFGEHQQILIDKIQNLNPHLIVLTGDMVDSRQSDFEGFAALLEGLKAYPIYAVYGNHETFYNPYQSNSPYGMDLLKLLKRYQVSILDNESVMLRRNQSELLLMGISDLSFYQATFVQNSTCQSSLSAKATCLIHHTKEPLTISDDVFSILLSHRPEVFKVYQKELVDLVLSGHTHGGQWVLPFVGPVFAPHQGFNPPYAKGLFQENGTTMIVSSGLGSSSFPLRLFNYPEIVVVDLISTQTIE